MPSEKYTCYAIKNKITGKIYIGITNDVTSRIKSHMFTLKNRKHSNKQFQEDHNNFNLDENDYEYYCLQDNINFNDRYDVETAFMLSLKSYIPEIGYNSKDPKIYKHIKQFPKQINIIYSIPKTNEIKEDSECQELK